MKILYVDISTDGHHQPYLKALIDQLDNEIILVLPDRISDVNCKQYIFSPVDFYHKKISEYRKWLKEIQDIAYKENPDIIHFLYGDVFYKYFGYGLNLFKQYKTVLTFHSMRQDFLTKISLKKICNKVDVAVFHTKSILKEVKKNGVENIKHIEYPHFNTTNKIPQKEAKMFFGINKNTTLLVCLGNTRYDKGLDILLAALKHVNVEFTLLIAGNEEAFDKSYIKDNVSEFKENVIMYLKYLTDEEFAMALNAADIITLPYRRKFNGASGPLGEGVWLDKMIVGPKHGSLGSIIEDNHLGFTFESENVKSLTDTLEKAINSKFSFDEYAKAYKNNLTINKFSNNYDELYHMVSSK